MSTSTPSFSNRRNRLDLGADSQSDAKVSIAALQQRAGDLLQRIESQSDTNNQVQLQHQLAELQIDMEQPDDAWTLGRQVFEHYIRQQNWAGAVSVCDTLFHCQTDAALVALGHGLWLGVTFPVDPMLTLNHLQHVIDETPDDSDGAAVAAAVAAFIVELRGDKNPSSEATLASGQMLNDVASRHGKVSNAEQMELWIQRLELKDIDKVIGRMRNVIDVLVQDDWWIDRTALQAFIPADPE